MRAEEILSALPGLSLLVVGDICVDRWCTYSAAYAEPSRETGIARIAVVSTEITPGAGGTVATNAAALGVGKVGVMGAIGEDGFGYELGQALRARGISEEYLVRSPLLSTFTYTKLLDDGTGKEDRPRVDFINTRPLPREVEREIVEALHRVHAGFDVILVADQAETDAGGVVTAQVREALSQIAGARPQAVIWADSRRRLEHFRKVTVKVNRDEANAACERVLGRRDYGALRRHIAAELLLVTCGGEGVLVVTAEGEELVETAAIAEPVDVCGAGDSFSAGAACALAAGASVRDAVRFGNLVASITVMKPGTGTASPREVLMHRGLPG